ncbi:MAG: hypothetical protein ACKV2T_06630 [Kofleriaceae bacterium]
MITGASRPLAYLAYAPAEGYRRVLAEYRGDPGQSFSATVSESTDWSDARLIHVTTRWRGTVGSAGLTLCLANPRRNDMNFPVCAFSTVTERWRITGYTGGKYTVPYTPIGPRAEWSVAIDRKYGVALVAQVRGEPDPSVPTGAFAIQPRR